MADVIPVGKSAKCRSENWELCNAPNSSDSVGGGDRDKNRDWTRSE